VNSAAGETVAVSDSVKPSLVASSGSTAGAVPVGTLVVLGAVAAWVLSQTAPQATGAARLHSPEVLLSIFDTVWLLFLLGPQSGGLSRAIAVLVVGAPFHLALAAASGAGPGFHAAWGLLAPASAGVGAIGSRAAPPAHGLGTALLAFALPLAAYALGDFARLDVFAWLDASPLVGPSRLARAAPSAEAGRAVPALIATGALLAFDLTASRFSREQRA
jgi:hypothetical protein